MKQKKNTGRKEVGWTRKDLGNDVVDDKYCITQNILKQMVELRKWKFIAICKKVDDYVKSQYKAFEDKGKVGLV